MPYLTCNSCGLTTFLVRPYSGRGACPGCDGQLFGRPHRHGASAGPPMPEPSRADAALQLARTELNMDVALLSEIEDDRWIVRHVAGEVSAYRLSPGVSFASDQTICSHVLDGCVDSVVHDVPGDDRVSSLAQPRAGDVRAYIGVPLTGPDGRRYVLCCFARRKRPDLGVDDVRFLRGLGESISLAA